MKKHQFIAGAICPNCQAQDRIVQRNDESRIRFYCIECGFDGDNNNPQALKTTEIKSITVKSKR